MAIEFIGIEIRDEDSPVERRIFEALQGGFYGLHQQMKEMEKRSMAAIDDLKAAAQLEATALTIIGQAVSDVATRVATLATSVSDPDGPDEEAVTAELNAHVATLQQLATALAAIAPAATVATPPANPVSTT